MNNHMAAQYFEPSITTCHLSSCYHRACEPRRLRFRRIDRLPRGYRKVPVFPVYIPPSGLGAG